MRRTAAVVAAAVGLIGLAPPASPAQAATQFGFTLRSGVVLGEGAAVDLTYTSACAPASDGAQAALAVKVAEATGPVSVATGSGNAAVTCDGTRKTIVLHIFPDVGSGPFAPGAFSIAGELTRYSADGNQDVTHSDGRTLKAGPAVTPPDVPGAPYVHVGGASLVAQGAAIDVRLAVKCPAGETWHAATDVRQAAGGSLVVGQPDTSTAFVCTGAEQPVTIWIFPEAGGSPFRTGVAVFSSFAAALSGCTTPVCARPTDWRVARITAPASSAGAGERV